MLSKCPGSAVDSRESKVSDEISSSLVVCVWNGTFCSRLSNFVKVWKQVLANYFSFTLLTVNSDSLKDDLLILSVIRISTLNE